ncbi:hypothetical protein GCM10023083_33510 [Streptomyces phyllanthi]
MSGPGAEYPASVRSGPAVRRVRTPPSPPERPDRTPRVAGALRGAAFFGVFRSTVGAVTIGVGVRRGRAHNDGTDDQDDQDD